MGKENVELAHERWGQELRGDKWRALQWMALRAWDAGQERGDNPARRYWGGHPLLAYGMGLIPRADVAKKLSKSHAERVRRVVRDLTKAGALALITEGKGQQHAVYELQLVLASLPVDTTKADPLDPSGSSDPE